MDERTAPSDEKNLLAKSRFGDRVELLTSKRFAVSIIVAIVA